MNDVPRTDWARITAYLAGDLPAEEQAALDQWLAANPDRRVQFSRLEAAWHEAGRSAFGPVDTQEIVDGVLRGVSEGKAGMGLSDNGVDRQVWQKGRLLGRQTLRRHIGFTAFVFGVLLVSAGTRMALRSPTRRLPVKVSRHTYSTMAGQHKTITLVDGARVLLGPATTLSVFASSNGYSNINLVGQALFTVMHRPTQPFCVHVGRAIVQVLGTTFQVKRYAADAMAQVVVREGRVALSDVRQPSRGGSVLTARMLGTVDDSGNVHVTPSIAIDDYMAWTTGRLVFHKTPAREVVIELGRAYGVEIRILDSALAAQPLSWSVTLTQRSLNGILESLADALDAHPIRAGRTITLVSGRTRSPQDVDPQPLNLPEHQYQYGK